jgi:hypothetical protein
VARRYYKDCPDLLLVEIDASKVGRAGGHGHAAIAATPWRLPG